MISAWQRIYDSAWHQPRLVLLLGALALAAIARWIFTASPGRSAFFAAWLVAWAIEAMTDARLTANDSPLLPAHKPLYDALAIAFVILGDARYYMLIERYTRDPEPGARGLSLTVRSVAMGLVWGTVASLVMAPLARTVPAFQANGRLIFLSYEVIALAQAMVWLKVVIPRRLAALAIPAPEATARWLRDVTGFVLAQYALWVLADVLIVWVHPLGFLLRLLPNILYYGVFVGYVFFRAPPAVRP